MEGKYEADATIFTFVKFAMNVVPVLLVSFFVICLAIVFPWDGNSVSSLAPIFFDLAIASSLYSLAHGYYQLYKQGLTKRAFFLWCCAIGVTLALAIDTIIFGSAFLNVSFPFLGPAILMSPVFFPLLMLLQALYFLSESVIVSVRSIGKHRHMADWYLTIYLFVLSMNSAAMLAGLLILGHTQI